MGNKPFTTIAAIIFLVMAIAHLFRLIDGWQVTIAGETVPMWISWIGLVVAGGLSVMLFREARR